MALQLLLLILTSIGNYASAQNISVVALHLGVPSIIFISTGKLYMAEK